MLRILSLFLLGLALSHAEDPAPQVWKTIELEWEKVDNAGSYEVRLTPEKSDKSLVIQAVENHLTQEVPVGNYYLQIRAKAKNSDDFSAWSPISDLEVAIKEIIPLHPTDKSVIDAEGSVKQLVEFQWSPVDKVREYTLKVWSEDKKDTPWIFTGHQTSKKLEVPPGRVYYWQVRFESANDVSYQQEPKTFSFILQGTQLLKPEINKYVAGKDLSWIGSEDSKAYQTKLFYRHLDETEWTPVREDKVGEPKLSLEKLKAGAYKIEITATAPRRLNSETSSYEFLVKPTAAELSEALTLATH